MAAAAVVSAPSFHASTAPPAWRSAAQLSALAGRERHKAALRHPCSAADSRSMPPQTHGVRVAGGLPARLPRPPPPNARRFPAQRTALAAPAPCRLALPLLHQQHHACPPPHRCVRSAARPLTGLLAWPPRRGRGRAPQPRCRPLHSSPPAATARLSRRLVRARRCHVSTTRLRSCCCWLVPCAASCAAGAPRPPLPPRASPAAGRAFWGRRRPPRCAQGWRGSDTALTSRGTAQTHAGRRCGPCRPRPSRAHPTHGTQAPLSPARINRRGPTPVLAVRKQGLCRRVAAAGCGGGELLRALGCIRRRGSLQRRACLGKHACWDQQPGLDQINSRAGAGADSCAA